MPIILLAAAGMLVLSATGFVLGRRQAVGTAAGGIARLHSLPGYHGLYVALLTVLPPLVVMLLWLSGAGYVINTVVFNSLPEARTDVSAAQRDLLISKVSRLATDGITSTEADSTLRAAAQFYSRLHTWGDRLLAVLTLGLAVGGFCYSRRRIAAGFRARNRVERIMLALLAICSLIAILTTVGIVLSMVFETVRFFTRVPLTEFLFGLSWSPRTAIREGQVGASGIFGVVPLLTGTLLITAIAMSFALPIGLLSAIFMVEFAPPRLRAFINPMIEILAGIPTVVYGFFAALTVAPFLSHLGARIGLDVSSQSALAAGSVMGIMIIPFVSSLSDDIIHAVPQELRDGPLALGATDAETVRYVVLPAALPGLAGAVIMAISHAIGETMIVLMAAGLYANLTANPLEAVTTITVQIATLLTGDQEFDSAKTLSAFALGLFLFGVTLCLNIVAIKVTQRYREQYE